MLIKPMDILTAYPVRKTGKQKQVFREDIRALVTTWGYSSREEKGAFGLKNLIIGDPEKADYLITAHYDTCARMPMPNFITPTSFFCFLGYQLLMAAVMLCIPLIVTVPLGLITGNRELAFDLWYGLFWVVLILMMVGPANKHNANDNTSGVVTLLEIARSLNEEQQDKVCFVLFDLEEAGLVGSSSYQRRHKKTTRHQIVLNLDCVGDGDEIWLFPTKKLRKDPQKIALLEKAAGTYGEKTVRIHKKGFSVYPSDQANFPFGVGICALKRKHRIPYMDRIHTSRDTVLEETNVNILRAAMIRVISGGAAQF